MTGGSGAAFDFHLPVPVRFGPGRFSELAAAVAPWAKRGPGLLLSGRRAGWGDRAATLLTEAGWTLARAEAVGEPTVAAAEALALRLRADGAGWVVAVGGGSVLDLAKAAAGLALSPHPALEHLEVVGAARPLERALPVVAVPTTAGTGAEVTRNAVLAVPERGLKVSLRSPLLFPAVALVDPDLLVGAPPSVVAASGADALVQLLEGYLSRRSQPWTDGLVRGVWPGAATALPRLAAGGNEAADRAALALGAVTSGVVLGAAGLGAVHALAGVLGGRLGAPHGALCGRLLAPVLRSHLTAAGPETHRRMAELARLALGRADGRAHDLVAWAEGLASGLGLPRLRDWGYAPGDASAVAAAARFANSLRTHPAELGADDLVAILADPQA